MVEEKFVSWFDEMAEKSRQEGREEGIQQGMQRGMQQGMQRGMQQGMQQGMQRGMQQGMQRGMQQGMRITYLLTRNPELSDEELNRQTGCDIENIRQIRKEIMEMS